MSKSYLFIFVVICLPLREKTKSCCRMVRGFRLFIFSTRCGNEGDRPKKKKWFFRFDFFLRLFYFSEQKEKKKEKEKVRTLYAPWEELPLLPVGPPE